MLLSTKTKKVGTPNVFQKHMQLNREQQKKTQTYHDLSSCNLLFTEKITDEGHTAVMEIVFMTQASTDLNLERGTGIWNVWDMVCCSAHENSFLIYSPTGMS